MASDRPDSFLSSGERGPINNRRGTEEGPSETNSLRSPATVPYRAIADAKSSRERENCTIRPPAALQKSGKRAATSPSTQRGEPAGVLDHGTLGPLTLDATLQAGVPFQDLDRSGKTLQRPGVPAPAQNFLNQGTGEEEEIPPQLLAAIKRS